MLDINFIKNNLEKVKTSVKARRLNVDLDTLVSLDGIRRRLIQEVDELRKRKNEVAKTKDIEEGKKIKIQLRGKEHELSGTEETIGWLQLEVPNILMDEVPIGDASKNRVIRKEGNPPKFPFQVKNHIELGRLLDIVDFERGVKVSGFRGYFLKNEGAKLHWAVLNFALDHISQKGYQVIIPPVINRSFALLGGGQFPWGEEDTYKVGEDKYLVGTSEIALMAMHADETFDLKALPKKYVALTPCFRTEIGSYGKDTKGLFRVHEFYKVEQVVLCEAEKSESLGFFEELQENSEEILDALELPYQVVVVSSEDMSKKAALQYDIETYMPSREEYGETHSNSICLDFQTRRLKIRYKQSLPSKDGKDKDGNVKFCHALNNTAIASPRILIAILENNQAEDGSVKIPEVLQKYTGFSEIRTRSHFSK